MKTNIDQKQKQQQQQKIPFSTDFSEGIFYYKYRNMKACVPDNIHIHPLSPLRSWFGGKFTESFPLQAKHIRCRRANLFSIG